MAGYGFFPLCLQCVDLHLRERLACRNEVSFAHENVLDPAGYLGCDIDFRGLDPAIAAGKSRARPGSAAGIYGPQDGH